MLRYIIRRLLIAIPVVLLVILATFVLVHSMPGGPFDAVGMKAMPEHIKIVLERRYGLDKPLYEQFARYVFNILKGDDLDGSPAHFDGIHQDEQLFSGGGMTRLNHLSSRIPHGIHCLCEKRRTFHQIGPARFPQVV